MFQPPTNGSKLTASSNPSSSSPPISSSSLNHKKAQDTQKDICSGRLFCVSCASLWLILGPSSLALNLNINRTFRVEPWETRDISYLFYLHLLPLRCLSPPGDKRRVRRSC